MNRLEGKRVVITQANHYMGPATTALFTEEGAHVISDTRDLRVPGACEELIDEAGHVDILVANLASKTLGGTTVTDLDDDAWATTFDAMVHPLHRLTRAVIPQMEQRQRGKIIV